MVFLLSLHSAGQMKCGDISLGCATASGSVWTWSEQCSPLCPPTTLPSSGKRAFIFS